VLLPRTVVLEKDEDPAVQSDDRVFYLNPAAKLDIIAGLKVGASMETSHPNSPSLRGAVDQRTGLATAAAALGRDETSAHWPGRCRAAAAIGVGVFIGCLPLFGSRLWICAGLASAFGLSRLRLYLAASVFTPPLAPIMALAHIQLGSYVQDGAIHPVSLSALAQTSAWHVSGDLLVGSLVAGTVLATFSAAATWTFARSWFDPRQEHLIAAAADSYLRIGLPAWKTANAKLRLDPVYRESVRCIDWPAEGRVLDLGCGRGLMLSVLAAHLDGRGIGAGLRLHGIEYRPRMVRLARLALGGRATVEQADLMTCPLPPSRVAMLFDVLHCLPESAQEQLLARLRASVEPGGYLLLREADASGGAGFTAVSVCNRIVALAQGRWERRFHFRTAAGWIDLLSRFGFAAEVVPANEGTPFANVLITARRVAP
jgi:SAM-dependent methyltransferase